jgi:hypothetical protein
LSLFLSLPVCGRSRKGPGGREPKFDEKAWPFVKHSILSGENPGKYATVQLFFTSFFISTERDMYKQTEQTVIRNGCGIPFDVFFLKIPF